MRIGASRASNGTDAWHRRYRNRLKSLTFGKLFGINAVAEIRAIVFTAGHCPLVGDLRHYHPYVLRTPNGPACVCVWGGGVNLYYLAISFPGRFGKSLQFYVPQTIWYWPSHNMDCFSSCVCEIRIFALAISRLQEGKLKMFIPWILRYAIP